MKRLKEITKHLTYLSRRDKGINSHTVLQKGRQPLGIRLAQQMMQVRKAEDFSIPVGPWTNKKRWVYGKLADLIRMMNHIAHDRT